MCKIKFIEYELVFYFFISLFLLERWIRSTSTISLFPVQVLVKIIMFIPIQIRFKSDSNPIQIRFKSDSNPIQIRFKSDSNPIQIRLYSCFSYNEQPTPINLLQSKGLRLS